MTTVLIIGSGPAAAGVALALSRHAELDLSVIDIGLELEAKQQQTVNLLASTKPIDWDALDVSRVSAQPVNTRTKGVPEKRRFGSDYPFRNLGQLDGLTASDDATSALISAAYGGFSTVWGSQLMPFTASTFNDWPFDAAAIRPHYEAILREIPFAGEPDALAVNFPLMGEPAPLPELSPRSQGVLAAYERHCSLLNARGVTLGKARLAFDAASCVRCRLCMTGCPYELIYSATHTFDELARFGRVKRHSGLMATKVVEEPDTTYVVAKELATGRLHRFEADRVFIACGAMGSTRLVTNSLGLFDNIVSMGESQQFVLPLISRRASPDPREAPDFTLNQFNMTIAMGGSDVDLSQLHFYTFNPAFVSALPKSLQGKAAERARVQLLRRLTVTLGYLPSWRSPQLRIRVRPSSEASLPDLHISRDAAPAGHGEMLRTVMTALMRSSRLLDLYPVLPMLRLAAGGKSYHIGGGFAHTGDRTKVLGSDRLGRVGPWQRTHVVDAAVFPTVPAMTFTLTIMANAHRIASEVYGDAA